MVSELVGFVTSVSMDQTISVLIPLKVKDPMYNTETRIIKRLLVHDDREEAEVGDCVLIEAVKKYSKTKKWQVVKILPLASKKSK